MTDTTPDTSNGPQWLPIAQAAALLGVSVRTARRLCESGKIAAQRVALEGTGGRAWRVASDGLGSELNRERTANGQTAKRAANVGRSRAAKIQASNERTDNVRPSERPNGQELAARPHAPLIEAKTKVSNPTAGEVEALRESLARERETLAKERENAAFLRGVIEQLQRDGAETRAALRKALELAPKELPAPKTAGATETRESGGAAPTMPRPTKSPQNGAQAVRTGAALTYADVLADLEARESA